MVSPVEIERKCRVGPDGPVFVPFRHRLPFDLSRPELLGHAVDHLIPAVGGVQVEVHPQSRIAEGLRNLYVCVDRAHAVKLPPGRYFVADMIGCRVEDSQGKPLGVLQEVLETGANDVYVIQGDRQLLVPALKKLLTLVDVAHKRIVLDASVLEEVGLFAD